VILAGYWALFAAWPLPGSNFDFAANKAVAYLDGFAAHWNKNTNPAHFFDQWFLNLFPRSEPFQANGGGYVTLSFIPSLATMIFGLIAGEYLRSDRSNNRKVLVFLIWGVIGLAAGWLLNWLGVCPIVKRIWTPSWTLFSTGWAIIFLAAFFYVIDVTRLKFWAFAGIVVGMNSIAIYCVKELFEGWIEQTVKTHASYFTSWITEGATSNVYLLLDVMPPTEDNPLYHVREGDPIYLHMLAMVAVVTALWLMCYWMYRRKLFIRI
ncbi:MAG: hypothetical protein AB7O38_19825, partial [Pirellulaceae bacterium]